MADRVARRDALLLELRVAADAADAAQRQTMDAFVEALMVLALAARAYVRALDVEAASAPVPASEGPSSI